MRRRKKLRYVLLLALIVGGGAVILRQGVLPARWTPLPAIDLSDPSNWLLDWRLAELRRDKALCQRILRAPEIKATPVADRKLRRGCGWTNAVRLKMAGGAHIGATMSCELAAGVALWMAHEVQPAAKNILGTTVTSVSDFGTYSCRNIVGKLSFMRSEHATANAFDISGFKLANGTRVSVLRDWPRKGAKSLFLRTIHTRACRYFRVTLGPEANRHHKNHFHIDRGWLSTCR